MMMSVDQPRHDQAATGIDAAVRRVGPRGKISNIDDPASIDVNTAVLDKAIFFIECDQVSVGDQQRTHFIPLLCSS